MKLIPPKSPCYRNCSQIKIFRNKWEKTLNKLVPFNTNILYIKFMLRGHNSVKLKSICTRHSLAPLNFRLIIYVNNYLDIRNVEFAAQTCRWDKAGTIISIFKKYNSLILKSIKTRNVLRTSRLHVVHIYVKIYPNGVRNVGVANCKSLYHCWLCSKGHNFVYVLINLHIK